jgi:hypothetical protein
MDLFVLSIRALKPGGLTWVFHMILLLRKWNVVYEKTDYKVDNPTDAPTGLRTNYPTTQSVPKQERYTVQVPYTTSSQEPYTAYRWVNKTDFNGRTYSAQNHILTTGWYTEYRTNATRTL